MKVEIMYEISKALHDWMS